MQTQCLFFETCIWRRFRRINGVGCDHSPRWFQPATQTEHLFTYSSLNRDQHWCQGWKDNKNRHFSFAVAHFFSPLQFHCPDTEWAFGCMNSYLNCGALCLSSGKKLKHKRVTLSTDGRFEPLTVYFLSIFLEEIFFLLLTLCGENKHSLIMCWEHNNAARLYSSAHLDTNTPFHFTASFINIIFP